MRFSRTVASTLLFAAIPLAAQMSAQTSVQMSVQTALPTPATRLAAQNALFEESWQTTLRFSPTLATAVGDYRYNDQLGDDSLAAIAQRHTLSDSYLARVKAIKTDGFTEEDRTSHDLYVRNLEQADADYSLKNFEMPISSMGGIHTSLADLPLSVPLDSVKHYEDYIARLRQVPVAFQQTEEVLRAGVKDHLMPVDFLIAKAPAQIDGILKADPFLLPLKKFPASFSDADKQRLTAELSDVVQKTVFPAYQSFSAFLTREYIPYGRKEISVESLPDGKRRYADAIIRLTTTHLPASEIHQIGLQEFDRIVAEMTALAKTNGYPDLPSFRTAVESNPKYVPASDEAIVDDFRKYIAQMRPKLPELFTVIPAAPVTVEGIPAFQASAATHYQGGTPDGKRPGRVSVAVADYAHRSLINDEAVAYHEGIPGHHMQISVAQTVKGLPEFRKHGGNSAYAEGWALYAEQLGKEVGFYQDAGSDYGRLRSELFRAVRLVVDTGIHDQGWTRQQVVDYMRASHAIDEPTIQAETDRYISMPAQALSYKLGQLKIRELRERARTQLGQHFDLRRFHDEVLGGGNLPLDLLEARIDRWIAGQMPAVAKQ